VLAARRVATDTWLESPGEDLADHVSRAIDLLAAGLTGDDPRAPGHEPPAAAAGAAGS